MGHRRHNRASSFQDQRKATELIKRGQQIRIEYMAKYADALLFHGRGGVMSLTWTLTAYR